MARRRKSKKRKTGARPRLRGGREDISFTGRSRIIVAYGPEETDRVVEKINRIAKAYASGRLSKTEYLEKVKKELMKAGLTEREWDMIYEKIREKEAGLRGVGDR